MKPGEEREVIDLVVRVFTEFVSPEYSQEGIREFMKYARADYLAKRVTEGNFVMLVEAGQAIIGVIEIRENSHIALLFVEESFQRKGIGKKLVRKAVELCQERNPDIQHITVNSSPNALTAYQKIGFKATGNERTIHGIRFIPMKLSISKGSADIADR